MQQQYPLLALQRVGGVFSAPSELRRQQVPGGGGRTRSAACYIWQPVERNCDRGTMPASTAVARRVPSAVATLVANSRICNPEVSRPLPLCLGNW